MNGPVNGAALAPLPVGRRPEAMAHTCGSSFGVPCAFMGGMMGHQTIGTIYLGCSLGRLLYDTQGHPAGKGP